MSFEEEWPLTEWPTRSEVERAVTMLCAIAKLEQPVIFHKAWGDIVLDEQPNGLPNGEALPARTTITLLFRVPAASAIDVALRLDPLAKREDYEGELEPVRGDIDWDAAQRAGLVTFEARGRSIAPEHIEKFFVRRDHYELAIDLVTPDHSGEETADVVVQSNTYDNREGYIIAAVIATDLSMRLEELSAFS